MRFTSVGAFEGTMLVGEYGGQAVEGVVLDTRKSATAMMEIDMNPHFEEDVGGWPVCSRDGWIRSCYPSPVLLGI